MRNELFDLMCVFAVLFLLIIAFLYCQRPHWLIRDDGYNNPDIDMWKALTIALLGAVLGMIIYVLLPYPFC